MTLHKCVVSSTIPSSTEALRQCTVIAAAGAATCLGGDDTGLPCLYDFLEKMLVSLSALHGQAEEEGMKAQKQQIHQNGRPAGTTQRQATCPQRVESGG